MPSNEKKPGTIQYTVQSGDTLWDLADEYELEVEEIMAANPGVNPDNLQIGQSINIPDSIESSQRRRPTRRPPARRRPYYPYRPPYYRPYPYYAPPVACPAGATPYSVQPGESLYSIAARFGISVDAIIATNPYVDFGVPLDIGQIICLPV